MTYGVTEFLGDGVSAELSEAVHSIAQALPFAVEFDPVDLSLEHRSFHGRDIYDLAMASMRETRVALKYPTTTEKESPNAVLRKMCEFTVIHRPVKTIPAVESNFTRPLNLDIVRVATGGTYNDPGQSVGDDVAVSVRVVERASARSAAQYAFAMADAEGANVTSSSKWTIQRATDGMFEEAVEDVAKSYPNVPYNRDLFDALLAKVVMTPEKYRYIITLNEYGDFLSDMACGLVGSLGIGSSASFSFTDDGKIELAMFDAAHGTAPDIAGKNLVNPTAILLAFAHLVRHLGEVDTGTRLESVILDSFAAGETTGDLGGTLSTREFTKIVRDRFAG
jgi:isocitrate dehydrogenase (NAD+)